MLHRDQGCVGTERKLLAFVECADSQNAGMNLLGATPIEDADMGKFRDTLMINVMGSVLVRSRNFLSQRPRGTDRCKLTR